MIGSDYSSLLQPKKKEDKDGAESEAKGDENVVESVIDEQS